MQIELVAEAALVNVAGKVDGVGMVAYASVGEAVELRLAEAGVALGGLYTGVGDIGVADMSDIGGSSGYPMDFVSLTAWLTDHRDHM